MWGLIFYICSLLACYLMDGWNWIQLFFHDNIASKSLFSYRPALPQNGLSGKKNIDPNYSSKLSRPGKQGCNF